MGSVEQVLLIPPEKIFQAHVCHLYCCHHTLVKNIYARVQQILTKAKCLTVSPETISHRSSLFSRFENFLIGEFNQKKKKRQCQQHSRRKKHINQEIWTIIKLDNTQNHLKLNFHHESSLLPNPEPFVFRFLAKWTNSSNLTTYQPINIFSLKTHQKLQFTC